MHTRSNSSGESWSLGVQYVCAKYDWCYLCCDDGGRFSFSVALLSILLLSHGLLLSLGLASLFSILPIIHLYCLIEN